MITNIAYKQYILIAITIIVLAAFGYGGYEYYKLFQENNTLKSTIASLTTTLNETQTNLNLIQKGNEELLASLTEEAEKSNSFKEHLDTITEDFNKLQWLSTLDEQLLEKYSKVYFLNENYKPELLSKISSRYLFNKAKPLTIHEYVRPYLQSMIREAEDDDINISVVSAYRSFEEQTALKSNYKVTYGSGANAFSADQGYSEHQLGTTVDFTTTPLNGALNGFEKTKAYTWLKEHAHEYGFILSYPQGNKYYMFEPWHWRFVGIDLATTLRDENKNFYDLDQREINTYLGNMFNH